MTNTFDTSKRPDRTREAGSPQYRRIAPPPERKESKRGARPYLVALALVFGVYILLWRLGPWRSGEDVNQRSEPASSGQLQSAKKASLNSSPAGGQKPTLPELDQEREPVSPGALESGRPLDPPPELLYEAPSLQRARAITLESETSSTAEPVPREPTAEELAGMPARRLNRSQARSIALADLVQRLPQRYLTGQSQPETHESAKQPDPPMWPESGPQEGAAENPDAQPGKAAAPAQPLRFDEVPSEIRDSIPISILMLVYSERPDNRRANINGSSVREGQEVSAGLKVEEITSDGVVFNYQGHSFYKAVRKN